jgi:hypothetical protein
MEPPLPPTLAPRVSCLPTLIGMSPTSPGAGTTMGGSDPASPTAGASAPAAVAGDGSTGESDGVDVCADARVTGAPQAEQ